MPNTMATLFAKQIKERKIEVTVAVEIESLSVATECLCLFTLHQAYLMRILPLLILTAERRAQSNK